ncbi:hypothetical protein HDU76_011682, partial [Blyttiomyces sp. JEL0837]
MQVLWFVICSILAGLVSSKRYIGDNDEVAPDYIKFHNEAANNYGVTSTSLSRKPSTTPPPNYKVTVSASPKPTTTTSIFYNTTLYDLPANFTYIPDGVLMTVKPIVIYYIFYGNFTPLEISRIENYAKHISDNTTVPDRWSVATSYVDTNGNRVNKKLVYGGTVIDSKYLFGKNLSTTMAGFNNFTDNGILPLGLADVTDMGQIITSYIGKGKPFAYNSHAIYNLITDPTVYNQDFVDNKIDYQGYHFSFNATIDDNVVPINHAFCHTLNLFTNSADLKGLPNGDTGRGVVDVVVDTLHHE